MTNKDDFPKENSELVKYLKKKINRLKHGDEDLCIIIVGKPRRGKSTLAVQVAEFMTDGKLTIDDICRSASEFAKQLKQAQRGEVVILDEAGLVLNSKEAMKPDNIELVKVLQTCGFLGSCMVFCIPNYFELERHIRTHRVDLLLRITKKGEYLAYSGKQARLIGIEKSWRKVHAIEPGKFNRNFPERLLEPYIKKSNELKVQMLDQVAKRDGLLSVAQYIRKTGWNENTVYKWIKSGKIKSQKIGGRQYIAEEVQGEDIDI